MLSMPKLCVLGCALLFFAVFRSTEAHTVNSLAYRQRDLSDPNSNPPPDRNALKRFWNDAMEDIESDSYQAILARYPGIHSYAVGIEDRTEAEGHAGIRLTLYGTNWTNDDIPGDLLHPRFRVMVGAGSLGQPVPVEIANRARSSETLAPAETFTAPSPSSTESATHRAVAAEEEEAQHIFHDATKQRDGTSTPHLITTGSTVYRTAWSQEIGHEGRTGKYSSTVGACLRADGEPDRIITSSHNFAVADDTRVYRLESEDPLTFALIGETVYEDYSRPQADYEIVHLTDTNCVCTQYVSIENRFPTIESFAAYLHDFYKSQIYIGETMKHMTTDQALSFASQFLEVTSVGAVSGEVVGFLEPEALFQSGVTVSGRVYKNMLRVNFPPGTGPTPGDSGGAALYHMPYFDKQTVGIAFAAPPFSRDYALYSSVWKLKLPGGYSIC